MSALPPLDWTLADWRRFRRAGGVVDLATWERSTPESRGAAVRAGYELLAEDATALVLAFSGATPAAAPEGGVGVPSSPGGGPGDVSRETPVRGALRAEADAVLADLRGGRIDVGGPV